MAVWNCSFRVQKIGARGGYRMRSRNAPDKAVGVAIPAPAVSLAFLSSAIPTSTGSCLVERLRVYRLNFSDTLLGSAGVNQKTGGGFVRFTPGFSGSELNVSAMAY
jgi:hypothetical protein